MQDFSAASDHTTSAFQELERLPMPPVVHLQKVPEVPASAGQFFDTSTIQCPCALVVSLLRHQLDRHVNVTQPLHLGIQHASEKYAPDHLGEKIGSCSTRLTRSSNSANALCAVSRVTCLAAVADENVCPA
jgi:hypothetical protein